MLKIPCSISLSSLSCAIFFDTDNGTSWIVSSSFETRRKNFPLVTASAQADTGTGVRSYRDKRYGRGIKHWILIIESNALITDLHMCPYVHMNFIYTCSIWTSYVKRMWSQSLSHQKLRTLHSPLKLSLGPGSKFYFWFWISFQSRKKYVNNVTTNTTVH